MFGSSLRVGLGNRILFPPAAPPAAGQPTFSNIVALVPFNGPDGDTGSAKDHSDLGLNWNAISAELDTAQAKWGTASALMDANNSSRYNRSDNAGLEPGSSPFCMEGWFRYDGAYGSANKVLFSHYNSAGSNKSFIWRMMADKSMQFLYSFDGVVNETAIQSAVQSFDADFWHHCAVSRDGSNDVRLFLRGNLIKTFNIGASALFDHGQLFAIGAYRGWTQSFRGWCDDFRYIIGEPLYTETFTPPIAPHPVGALQLEGSLDDLLLEDGAGKLELE